jgi:hypothetical protein
MRDLEHGRGGKEYFEQALALRERSREALAGVLEVPSENVALVSSTTNACNVVLAGLGLTAGDEIISACSVRSLPLRRRFRWPESATPRPRRRLASCSTESRAGRS